jgi:hypothetical protein
MAAPTTNSNVTRSIAQTAQYVQELWTRDIQQPFDKELHIAKLVQDRSGLAQGGGDTINVPFVAGVNARAKAASTQVTFDSPDGTAVALSIDKHYYVAVLIEDIAKIQSNYDLKAAFQQRMSEALARQVDTDLSALYTSAGTVVSCGTTVDDADILSIVYTFDSNNTPQSLRRGVIGHNTKTDLLGVNKYVAYDQTGKTGVAVSGSTDSMPISNVYGLDMYHGGNVPTTHNMFFHKNALTLIQQQAPKFEMEYVVRDIGWNTVLHTVYGVGVERAGSVIDVTRTSAA